MPNQRHSDKVKIGAWVLTEEEALLQRRAARLGLDVSALIRQLAHNEREFERAMASFPAGGGLPSRFHGAAIDPVNGVGPGVEHEDADDVAYGGALLSEATAVRVIAALVGGDDDPAAVLEAVSAILDLA